LPSRAHFGGKTGDHTVEQGQRPLAVEEPLGIRRVRRVEVEAFVRVLPVQREMFRAAPALLGLRAVPFVGEEVLQRGEQEGAELAAFGGEAFEVVLLQKAGEERLHEILRVLLRLPLPAHEGVERIPIRLAQLGQRPFGVR
jgi:hypothetical protein